MIRFAHPEYLYLLASIPLVLGLFAWAQFMRRRDMERFGNISLLRLLIPFAGGHRRAAKITVLSAALAFLVVGLANPQIGTKFEELKREGVDIFIALDVSHSMRSEDIKPNRLESAKRQIGLLVDKLQNDRIGLIVFAGDSYLQLPLTSDYGAAKLFLTAIDVDIVPVQGTAIGSAIELARKSFTGEEKKYKVLLIITDGENHEDDAIAAATTAASEGIIVHTIGMGSPLGSPIPVYQGNIQVGYKKDSQGNVVVTKLDEAVLQQVAATGNGTYLRASNQQGELDAILQDIQAMEKKEFGAKVFTEYEDRFQYLLLPAFLFIVLEFFVSERKSLRLEKWRKTAARPMTVRKEYSHA